jgi:hypothetical protein
MFSKPALAYTVAPLLSQCRIAVYTDHCLCMLSTTLLVHPQRLNKRRRSKQQAHTAAAASTALDALWQSFAALIAAAQQQAAAVAQLSDALLVVADAALGAVLHRHVPLRKRLAHSSKEAATAQQVLSSYC